MIILGRVARARFIYYLIKLVQSSVIGFRLLTSRLKVFSKSHDRYQI